MHVQFANENPKEVIEKLILEFNKNKNGSFNHDAELLFDTRYGTLIKGGLKTFGCNYGFQIKFSNFKYEVLIDEFSEDGSHKRVKFLERLLHKRLSEVEMHEIVNKLTNAIFEHIDFYSKKNGLR